MQDAPSVQCTRWSYFCRDVVGCVRRGGWALWGLVWLGEITGWLAGGRCDATHGKNREGVMMYVFHGGEENYFVFVGCWSAILELVKGRGSVVGASRSAGVRSSAHDDRGHSRSIVHKYALASSCAVDRPVPRTQRARQARRLEIVLR